QDLADLYNADRHGLPAPPLDAPSYRDYVRSATRRASDDAAAEEYWVRRFTGGTRPLELPTDRQRPPVKTFRGSHVRSTFDPALYREIKRLGARHGCTLYVTLLAAWQALVFRLTHQTDITIGIPVAATRTLDEVPPVGHCVNMLP